MPPTRQTTKQIPAPSIPSASPPFNFPDNSHLVITTPRHVFAWDKSGIHSLFRSRRSSIVAAREAKDGSGVLAIASRNVVVLHDTKRGKDESWGLNATDEVRHLEYTNDAKSLFLTTTSDGTIQQYDTESARLLDPAEKLVTPPVALAVSPTGHIVLSASHDPPVVHIKNLTHNTTSSSLHPNASAAPVSFACFHPERPNIFLLAFRDGTVAAYDATKIPKSGPDESSGKDGEISLLQNLHHAVVTGDSSLDKSTLAAPITGAAFLPGYKTRAVTAGRDGKCKIVDFAKQGVVIRSWHAKAPLTSISVLAMRPEVGRSGSRRSQASSHTIGGPTSTDSLIALGRVDGKVHIYDTVGLLLAQKAVSGQEEKIISLEWVKGNTPRAIDLRGVERHFSDAVSTSLRPPGAKEVPQAREVYVSPKPSPFDRKDKPVRKATPLSPATASISPARKLTFHPDELEAEQVYTVRHNASPQRTVLPALASAANYNDLFSPVKAAPTTMKQSPDQRVTSPGRNRPRLSSQTFVKSPKAQVEQAASPRNVTSLPDAESHATSSSSSRRVGQRKRTVPLRPTRRVSITVSPVRSTRRISFAQPAVQTGDGTASRNSATAKQSSFNAKVLSDLRKLNGSKATTQHRHGMLSTYSAPQRAGPAVDPHLSKLIANQLHEDDSAHAEKRSVHLSDSETWPTDSIASSFSRANDDIWLTSGSEDDTSQRRQRRPPARQTSRSKIDEMNTIRTLATIRPVSTYQPQGHRIDGSTEEEMFSAATHISPFSPASEELRELVPRSSSLSPHKNQKSKKRDTHSPKRRGLGLTALALNAALARPRRVPSPRKTPVMARRTPSRSGLIRSPSYNCLRCPETAARVQGLENEVAAMKGEILAMKALLRRNGLPFPACLR